MKNIKYKEGDRVRIKSLDWYNENKDEDGDVPCDCNILFLAENKKYLGTIQTVEIVYKCEGRYLGKYIYKLKGIKSTDWTDEMIEGLVESIEDRMKELRKMCTISLNDSNYSDKVEVLLNDYEYVEEGGKSYFVKKKKEYPKTYKECCKVLNIAVRDLDILDNMLDTTEIIYIKNLDRLLNSFRKLLVCRDAYWKIAGEEMGLGKPWEPDWTDEHQLKYTIYTMGNDVIRHVGNYIHAILSFPTEEMRDAFKENFDPDIEICKDFL